MRRKRERDVGYRDHHDLGVHDPLRGVLGAGKVDFQEGDQGEPWEGLEDGKEVRHGG